MSKVQLSVTYEDLKKSCDKVKSDLLAKFVGTSMVSEDVLNIALITLRHEVANYLYTEDAEISRIRKENHDLRGEVTKYKLREQIAEHMKKKGA
jgi:hypothetical protein